VEVARGGEHIANLGPGDVFGEVGVLDDALRNATVTATSRLKLIIIDQLEVQRLKETAPEIYARIEKLAEERSG
jgi:CRP/FNR family transcriptional regulator, cyclic AMP receptor protein